jgi:NDP-sugar pyrophosphorylase family protein
VGAEALPPVCILAGGLGTRLGERARGMPKPLVEVAGEPFLIHQLRLLAAQGVTETVICVGYQADIIESRIGSTRFGLSIAYSRDSPELDGTLGAIRRALPLLGERFLVLYGDTYLRVDYRVANRAWHESSLPALIVVLHNQGRWDTSNVRYEHNRVLAYDKHTPTPEMSWIDYGLGGLDARTLDRVDEHERDLAALYRTLARRGELCGFAATKRFYEIGTPASLEETERFIVCTRASCRAGEVHQSQEQVL